MTKKEWQILPAGTKLRCIRGFKTSDGEDRLIEGQEYEFLRYTTDYGSDGSVVTKGCSLYPSMEAVNWGNGVDKDGSEHFEVIRPALSIQELFNEFKNREAWYNSSAELLANAEDDLQAAGRALVDRLNLEIGQ